VRRGRLDHQALGRAFRDISVAGRRTLGAGVDTSPSKVGAEVEQGGAETLPGALLGVGLVPAGLVSLRPL
jgi:hypothetical protein